MSVLIPSPPRYRRVPYDLRGLSWLQQIKHDLQHPPRLEILEDWIIILSCGLTIIIPAGFITDGASIPRWLWWFISPFGPLLEGALVHDFGFQYGYLLAVYSVGQAYNLKSIALRKQFAGMFGGNIPVYIGKRQEFFDNLLQHVTLGANGASLHAWLARTALLFFGHHAWDKYRLIGPGAYNNNSLGLPGVDERGKVIV